MKNKRTTLFHSIIALLLCVSMLVGTTFAWFTDSVKTGINTIAAGNLDVELYHSNAAASNERVDSNTKLFMDLQGDPILWEPGVVSYENLRITNEGNLAMAYQLAINIANENFVVDGSNLYGLSQILKVGVVEGGITATDRAGVLASVKDADWTTFANFLRSGSLLPEGAGTSEETWGIVIYWEPGDNDNFWNLNNDKQLSEGDVLSIDLGVNLIATQEMEESDSFNNEYDENAKAEFFPGFQGGSAAAVVTPDDQGLTTAAATMDGGDVAAVIPAGVQVAEGTTSMALSVTMKSASEANIQLGENEEMRPLDVHIEGVAEGNTVPMLITLKNYLSTGINTGALRLYHVENGATVAMTQVAVPANHNEFSYDPATGDLTLALASFSEIAVVANENNPWDGETRNYLWYDINATELTIYNADQLAGLADIVDGKAEGIAQDSFSGKTVKLANNITLSNVNFDPIGWGYDYDGYTPDGKTFNGTFDGDNHFIFDLKQDGWDLGYSYSMAGGGLFASVVDATIKNLKISGANIRMECIDMGVLVGYSQGNCTYENIDIYNSKIANYQRSTGGVVGEVTCKRDTSGNPVGESVHTFDGVRVHNDVVVGTLWGDFDAACGGVIGGRWDDDNTTKVVMKNVEVRCRLDVYNDATAAYQWHAYRRAGMLIGNTDLPYGENRLAQAPFLTCENVDVYYGDWVNYTYCQFTNASPSYPWVRTQAGENCDAFSNPRWGVPNDMNGNRVTGMNHKHQEGDECNQLRQFAQLYGGGQGVYGQSKHTGVTVKDYVYSVTYMNDYKVLDIQYVTDNSKAFTTGSDQAMKLVKEWADKNIEGNYEFNNGWMNAGSTKVPTVSAGNEKDIVLYPYFNKPYTARFVDTQGNVIAWCFFHEEDTTKLAAALEEATKQLPDPGTDFALTWEVHANGSATPYNDFKFGDCKMDVTVYPVYQYTGNLKLTPVDVEPADGVIDYYRVDATQNLSGTVNVPGKVNGIPVAVVQDLCYGSNVLNLNTSLKKVVFGEGVERIESKSIAFTSSLEEIVIPSTLEYIGKNAFASDGILSGGVASRYKTITITYNGTKAQWNQIEKANGWGKNVKEITVVCTDGTLTY